MNRFSIWTEQLRRDGLLYVWGLGLLMVFRLIFLLLFYKSSWNGDVLQALFLGLRISLKTIGIPVLLSFVLATLPSLVFKRWPGKMIRAVIVVLMTVVLTLLFAGRIPYFTIFDSGYNIMLINGAHDDWSAIIKTAVDEYGLLWRLPIALIGSVLLAIGAKKFVSMPLRELTITNKKLRIFASILSVPIIGVLFLFCRFGGGFNYEQSINWENAGRTSSQVLNETIIDDGQALYRVYAIHQRMKSEAAIHFTADDMRNYIARLGGNPKANTFDDAFRHVITKERLTTQPKTVVLILGESYPLYPYLPAYKNLGSYVTATGNALINSGKGTASKGIMAFGSGTMPAVNGYVSGLTDVGLYTNYEPESFKAPYNTGIGNMMKHLGYKTVFVYGGYGTWQGVRDFVLAQGFDTFLEASNFKTGKENGGAWGLPDGDMFKGLVDYIKTHDDGKTFYFVLTTSNHPPYSVDLNGAGFDASKLKYDVAGTIPHTDEAVKELGHLWYADHVMGDFVKSTEAVDPTALFVITGDHNERFTFAKEVDQLTYAGVPAIIYGQGMGQNPLPNRFGTAQQLAPTIAELVGRPGQVYYSMVPSLYSPMPFIFNYRLWSDGETWYTNHEPMSAQDRETYTALRNVALWRIKRGNTLE